MKFHNSISSNFTVYDKNLPSCEFLKNEKKRQNVYFSNIFFSTNLPTTGQVLTVTGTGLKPIRNGS